MHVKEKTRQEIERKLSGMGEYVKMDYLLSCLKNHLDFDTKKFVLVTLSGLYEKKKMFVDAAKVMNSAAEINTIFQNKINDFVRTSGLFIKGSDYSGADISMRKALAIASDEQKIEIKKSVKEYCKLQARIYLEKNKRKNAVEMYENLLDMELDNEERAEIRYKLLELYENLGKVKEYYTLKRQIQSL